MISNQDKEWILKKLKTFHKTEDVSWEYELMEYAIQKNNPPDIRTYVENELKKKNYDNKLKELSNRISPSLLGNNEKCDKLSDEINKLLDEAEKEFPGFKKGRALQISEISQRIMAYRSKGAVGHQAEVRDIRKEQKRR